MADYMNELDAFFDDFFSPVSVKSVKYPPVDIEESQDGYRIQAEVPGFDEEHISIYVEKHVLHIKGEAEKKESEGKDRKYLLRERTTRAFERRFSLPEGVNEEEVSASYDKGVLTVTVPKAAKPEVKRINITK